MLQVVLEAWVALLVATTLLFVLVCCGQRVWRTVRTGAEQARAAVDQQPAEQRSAA